MAPLEIATYSKETRRWRKAGKVEPGNSRTLYSHIPEDNKKEMFLVECKDEEISIISSMELDPGSSVEPGRLYDILPGPESPKEVARLEKGNSFEITIKEAEYGIPTQYRFTHK